MIPLSAASKALPASPATETTLSAINAKIPAAPSQEHTTADSPHSTRLTDGLDFYKATTPSDTQPVSAASLPLPAGASSEATLGSILTELGKKTEPSDTQPVSAVSLPLPAGASSEATLGSILTELGQKTEPADTQIVDQANAAEADYDTGGSSVRQTMMGIALPGPGGPVPGGTAHNPLWVDLVHPIIVSGGPSSAGTSSVGDVDVLSLPALPAGTNLIGAVELRTPDGDSAMDEANNAVRVNIIAGAGSGGIAQADESTFTEGTTQFTPVGGVYSETASSDPAEDEAAAARITAKRGVHVNLRTAAGVEIGVSGAPVRTDPTGTTTQPVSGTVTANLAAGSNNIGDVDVLSSALPTGAATLAEQQAQSTKLDDILTELGEKTEPADNQNVVFSGSLPAGTNNIGDVDVLSLPALPAGTNNIGDVDVVSSALPTGAATEATLGSILTELGQKTEPADTQTIAGAVTVSSSALPTGAATETTLAAINTKIPASPSAEHTTAASPNAARLSDGTAFYKATTPSDTQPVSIASVPLPTGAATEATLSSLNAKVTAVNTGAVVVSSSALPTGAATSANQSTQTTALQLIDDIVHTTNGALNSVAAIGGHLDDVSTTAATENNVAPIRITAQRAVHSNLRNVAGTEIGTSGAPVRTDPTGTTTQPVSVSSMPLPTGAATEATLSSLNSKVTAVNTGAVVISGALPAGTNNIGDVDVLTLPALPAGSNNIGDVDVLTLPALPAGANNIGSITNVTGTVSLPTGAATEATLSSLNSKVTAVNTGAVVVSSSALPTGAATAANQSTQTTALQLIDDIVHTTNAALNSVAAIGGQLDDTGTTAATENNVAALRITAQRALHANLRNVAGTEIGTSGAPVRTDPTGTTTQPVSAASLPLPTGAATEATLSTLNGKVTACNTGAVVISSALPAGANNIGDVDVVSSVLPTGAATETTLAAAAASLSIVDDWDEADRAKVNLIAGQAGVQGGAGAVTALTQRVVVASDQTAIPVVGNVAENAVDSGLSIKIGGRGSSQDFPVTVDDLDRVDAHFDLHGRLGVWLAEKDGFPAPYAPPLDGQSTTQLRGLAVRASNYLWDDGMGESNLARSSYSEDIQGASVAASGLYLAKDSSFAEQRGIIIGQQAAAKSVPVVLASDQSAVPVSGTVTATTALTALTVTETPEVSVTTADTTLKVANASRKKLRIQNHGTGFVRVSESATAVATSPIRLVPVVGEYWVEPTATGHIYQGEVSAISESGTNLVGVTEYT